MSKKINSLCLTIKANIKILQTKINRFNVSEESAEMIVHELEQHISNITNMYAALDLVKDTEPESQVERTKKELETYKKLSLSYVTQILKKITELQDKIENDISTFANLKNEAFLRMTKQGDEPQFEDHRIITRMFRSFSKQSTELQGFIDTLEAMKQKLSPEPEASQLGA